MDAQEVGRAAVIQSVGHPSGYMVLDLGVASFWRGTDVDGDALTAKLNDLGYDGWEAVGFPGLAVDEGRTKKLIMVLERPR